MTTRNSIAQGVRAWLRASCVPGRDLEHREVVLADQGETRVKLPYLTVKVTSLDVPVGADEEIHGIAAGNAVISVRGLRTGTLSVQGFGEETSDWLSRAVFALRLPTVKALLHEHALTIAPLGGQRDLTRAIDTSFEPRFLQEFRLSYMQTSQVAETVISAETVETTNASQLDDGPGDPDPLPLSLSASLEP